MHSIPIIFTFWPGLPQLWLLGRWSGLLKAIIFAAFLNFVLIATYVLPELVSKTGLVTSWVILGFSWIFAIVQNDWVVSEFAQNQSKPDNSEELDGLFEMAQSEYLQGHFDEAENSLERLIWLCPGDLDARLYLATVFRHRGRLHQALNQLDVMEKYEHVTKWQFQIAEERNLISELETELRPSRSKDVDTEINMMEDSLADELQGRTTRHAA